MKKVLKFISLIIVFCLLISQVVLAQETAFSDLKEDYWAYKGIQSLVDAKIIDGYPDGTFKPENNITRAELVKIVNLIFNFTDKQDITTFTDIVENEWYYNQILIAQKAGYVNGYPDGTFKPNNNITREEFCKILDDIVKLVELPGTYTPADQVSAWAFAYVNKVLSNRIMATDENNNFRATEFATRAEVSEALAKFLIAQTPTQPGGGNSGSSSGGGSSNSPSNEQELYDTMSNVISVLNKDVKPLLSNEQNEIVNDITSNMEKYINNSDHDYKKAAEKTYEKYKKLDENEQEELIKAITKNVPTLYLNDLKDFFFPDATIN